MYLQDGNTITSIFVMYIDRLPETYFGGGVNVFVFLDDMSVLEWCIATAL